jgi:EmrB/QacA subfamily drug resistance transporter
MENLDGTIVTTAAPRIGAALHVPSSSVGLVITAYLVTLAVLIPLSGWMVAAFGVRRVFLSAIAVFTGASVLCAASANLVELVAVRVLQGAGGAMMVPVGRLAVLSRTAKPDMMRMIAYIVWPALVAPVIAPLAGGLITTYASWRWMFLINVPLGVVALAVAYRLVRGASTEPRPPLDVGGVLLTSAGLAGVIYTAHVASQASSGWAAVAVPAGLSGALLVAAVHHLLRARAPLVDLRTLRVRSLRAFVGGGTLFGVTVGAVPFMLPLLFETVYGWGAVKSGSVVLFVFAGNIGIKPATTFLINRFGFRAVIACATAGLAVTVSVLGLLPAGSPLAIVVLTASLSGMARSVGFTAYTNLAFSEVSEQDMRHANGLVATAQQLAAGLGVALATVALRLAVPLTRALALPQGRASNYGAAFVALALVALMATFGAVRLRPEMGISVRKAPLRKAV